MGDQVESSVVFIVDSEEQALLVRRKNSWGFPKCVLRPEEIPLHAALRAIKHRTGLVLDSKSVSVMLCDKSVYGHKIYFYLANVESFGRLYKNVSLHTEDELRVMDRIDPIHRGFLWAIKTKVPQ